MLNLWNNTKTINSKCNFFYYNDMIINSLTPNFISTKAFESEVKIEVRGLFFRNDNQTGNSF